MSYIGRNIDSINNISTLDNLSFNGSDTVFNLTQNSVAFNIISVDALQIQIDGIIQVGNFTQTGGSQITFDFTPNSGSVCNSVKHFGVGLLTTVSDSSITTAKLGADSVNGSKIADNSIDSEHYVDGSIDLAHMSSDSVNESKLQVSNSPTNGYMLTAQSGNTGGLTWAEAGSGTHVKLLGGTASSSVNHDFTGFIDTSTYDNYWINLGNVKGQSGNTVDFQFTDSGGALTGANYYYAGEGIRSSGTAFTFVGEQTNQVQLIAPTSGSTDHPTHCQFYMTINPNATREGLTIQSMSWGWRSDVSDTMIAKSMGWFNGLETMTGFRLHASGNDATTFDYAIYGITK